MLRYGVGVRQTRPRDLKYLPQSLFTTSFFRPSVLQSMNGEDLKLYKEIVSWGEEVGDVGHMESYFVPKKQKLKLKQRLKRNTKRNFG